MIRYRRWILAVVLIAMVAGSGCMRRRAMRLGLPCCPHSSEVIAGNCADCAVHYAPISGPTLIPAPAVSEIPPLGLQSSEPMPAPRTMPPTSKSQRVSLIP